MGTGETNLQDVYSYAGEAKDFVGGLLTKVEAFDIADGTAAEYQDAAAAGADAAGDGRPHRLRERGLRPARGALHPPPRPLHAPRRRELRGRDRPHAPGPGLQPRRLLPPHARVFGRLAHARRTGQDSSAQARRPPPRRAYQPPRHREHPVAGLSSRAPRPLSSSATTAPSSTMSPHARWRSPAAMWRTTR